MGVGSAVISSGAHVAMVDNASGIGKSDRFLAFIERLRENHLTA